MFDLINATTVVDKGASVGNMLSVHVDIITGKSTGQLLRKM